MAGSQDIFDAIVMADERAPGEPLVLQQWGSCELPPG
ncbi:ORAOV1 isoform 10 [Pongo abelii]|uniref:ORAOV1 isoform 10 n=1 Tax=Pongo abelii TaxID=9601 RepID=A0A2J8U0W2_PONAB|nr:ORAOV1 isoform 10 [Pongo abelii]